MSKKIVLVSVAVAFLLGGILGFLVRGPGEQPWRLPLGAAITVPTISTTTHGTANQSVLLYQWEYNVVESISPFRASSTPVTIDLPSLGNATGTLPTAIASTTAIAGVVVGDPVFVTISTSTTASNSAVAFIQLIGYGCGAGTVCFTAVNASSAAINLGPETFNFKILKTATPVLKVTTSSTPYND